MIRTTKLLTRKELSVLIALQENPLATFEQLSERVGLSKSIVFGVLKDLSSDTTPYFIITASLHRWNLGLKNVDILVSVDNRQNLEFIEEVCYQHPYTSYRARSFGQTSGLLIQFVIPDSTQSFLKELFDQLLSERIIDSYEILPLINSISVYTSPNVDFWNPMTNQWEFNWNDWLSMPIETINEKKPIQEYGNAKTWLTKSDIAILKELVRNARRKNLEIIEMLKKDGYEFTPQTFSRRLKKIQEECVQDYKVFLNPSIFDLYSSILITGKGKRVILEELQMRIKKYPIPFTSTFKIFEENLFWYLHLPPTHLSDLLFYLRNTLESFTFNFIDFVRAQNFLPWPETFDETTSDWRRNSEFFIEQVLTNTKNKMSKTKD